MCHIELDLKSNINVTLFVNVMFQPQMVIQRSLIFVFYIAVLACDSVSCKMLMLNMSCNGGFMDPLFTIFTLSFVGICKILKSDFIRRSEDFVNVELMRS